MPRTTRAQAVEAIDNIDVSDPEAAHIEADAILLELAGPEVREAYDRLVKRSRWW